MKLFVANKYFWILAIVAIVLLGFHLREIKLYEVPRLGATFDEYAWTWLGISLITSGTPVSWSPHPQYKNVHVLKLHGAYFRIVRPYLEHPPAFGLIAGIFALTVGAKEPLDVMLYHVRPLALILGVISVLLVFTYSNILYGKGVALLSTLLFATIPTVVIGSRLVQNENFFIPLWLTGLVFVYLSIKKNHSLIVIPAVIAFLLVISKIPFIAGGLSYVALYGFYKLYKAAGLMLLAILLGLSAYILYGFYYDPDLLLGLLQLQIQRYDLTFNSIFSIFEKPYLADRFFTDGWILWGFVSFFLLLTREFKKNIFIILPFLTYFGVFMAGIPDEPGHGWYRYPFYPFLIVSIALFVKEYFAKNYLLTFFFISFIGTSLLQNVYAPLFGFSFTILRVCIITWAIILLPNFFDNNLTKKASFVTSYTYFTIFILLNIINSATFVD